MNATTTWLTCGVLRAELNELLRQGKLKGELFALDSMLHMDPPRLETILDKSLQRHGTHGGRLVLIFGDCCPRMLNLVRKYQVGRINTINCAQMLLGKTRYRELMKEESFLFLPEWTKRWKEIFRKELGLSETVAHDLMQDNRGNLVYLDTGLVPVPHHDLQECSAYLGLPMRIENVSLDNLLAALLEAEALAPINQSATETT